MWTAFRISRNETAFPLSADLPAFPLSADLPRQLHFKEVPGSCLSWSISSPLQGWWSLSACTLEPSGGEATADALQSCITLKNTQMLLQLYQTQTWAPKGVSVGSLISTFPLQQVLSFVFSMIFKAWELCSTAYGFLLWTALTTLSRRSWCSAVPFVSVS